MTHIIKAEYLWLDGARPTQRLRSKTRLLPIEGSTPALQDFPEWGFDGSSTYQATGDDSDLKLRPVRFVKDPTRQGDACLVLCEVFNYDDSPHPSNKRARLRALLDGGVSKAQAWFGFEQEYTLFRGTTPLGWPQDGYPAPQGPYYCGVGARNVFGRELVERHIDACMDAGVMIYGVNAEVMPGQWEFQVGYRGITDEQADPLTTSDHLWFARWLLHRLSEKEGVHVSFDCKPVFGDWNGAGMHTNFSTEEMRTAGKGLAAIEAAVVKLSRKHDAHIAVYGAGLEHRLTGLHETCAITEFRHGVADRGASIRVPSHVSDKGCGYMEDRRPGANADPYDVCDRILRTICDVE
ncbi:MAG: glutamine synthetase beta-grasp domain-containing protein [Polyangiales bacterium]